MSRKQFLHSAEQDGQISVRASGQVVCAYASYKGEVADQTKEMAGGMGLWAEESLHETD